MADTIGIWREKWLIKNHYFCCCALIYCSMFFLMGVYSRPDFVMNSQIKLQSYLTNSFGPVSCEGLQVNEDEWKLVCEGGYDEKKYEYLTHRVATGAAYKGAYYITALNENAKKNVKTGLLTYLDIR